MNKFAKMLSSSSKEIRGIRASMLAEDSRFAQEDLVRNLESEKREIERQLIEVTDLHPDSELTLMVTRKGFDPKAWTSKIQELKVALAAKTIEVELAKETYKEWFEELPAKPAKADKNTAESK